MSTHLVLLPAVDVADGQAVQLVQGVAGSEKRFGDPLGAALRWQDAGAEWIHLVDLDAAFGRGHNRELLSSIVGRVDVAVELSGGIRDDERGVEEVCRAAGDLGDTADQLDRTVLDVWARQRASQLDDRRCRQPRSG